MSWLKKLFRRKKPLTVNPAPLTIQGIPPAPLTPEPDAAEQAAQALLEMMASQLNIEHGTLNIKADTDKQRKKMVNEKIHNAAYYHQLADRIRQAQEAARQRTVRFVAFVEQELRRSDLPATGRSSLQMLETELYKRLDIVDRVGGDLKRRWQHCLAEVIVRLMQASNNTISE